MQVEPLLQRSLQTCSIDDVTELTVRQARELLARWASEQSAVTAKRDEVILAAVDAGLSKSEVHRLTGVARTTIDRVLAAHTAPARTANVQPEVPNDR